MGSLLIMEQGGHVEVKWAEDRVDIDLNPDDGDKANSPERREVLELVKKSIERGFKATFGDQVVSDPKEIPKKVRRIRLERSAQEVKTLIEELIRGKVISDHLLFSIDKGGTGKLLQKSDFQVDAKEKHTAVKPLAGG